MPIDILQTSKLLASCEQALAAKYTVHKLHEAADKEALLAAIGDKVRGIAGGGVKAELMDRLPRLEIIANFGVGYDSIDTQAAKARNIRVTNTPNVLNDAVAELTIGLMIALGRRIPQADRYVRDGNWPRGGFPLQSELNGKTVGILGLGRIGKEIAIRAQAMKMRVVYHGRRRQADEPFVYYSDLAEMARDADWLVIIAPGGKGTEKIVSRQVLAALGPEGYLVNMARGSLVDEAAMVEMLQNKTLGGAALDVFEQEPQVPAALFGLDNVVLSPHQGSATRQTRDKMGALVVANLDACFAGEPLISPVV
ncbi:MAG: hydroxyacid dehydrogenase [Devosia sp. 67-54]|uniref:2-hydroxyacid dehydrogenase n=1 Tax=unclassified Devosia TaxID=196773 RepID=UPI00095EB02C|nr:MULTISPECIES: 2-hydroxyacid dehydrogenase [unclassified Devosia]MBN9306826.1 2-hydroxyacid dehydrogenase [Devosia sp.]OJX17065.1 MAG: hydroxyacid dehydrogenase [Devosia sp. 67-54]